MTIKGLFITGFGFISCAGLPPHAAAQSAPEPTPRQVFVSFITGTPIADLTFKSDIQEIAKKAPVVQVAPTPDTPPVLEAISPSIPKVSDDGRPPEAPKASAGLSMPLDAPLVELEQATKTPKLASLQPFYVTAEDYLEARGSEPVEQIILDYKVTPINTSLGLSADSKPVRMLIGADFVAVTREGKTRTFDFKMRRLLSVRPTEDEIVFDNISLFPIALKNIETVKSTTRNGTLDEIQVSSDKILDAFWMEASLGWSARENINALTIAKSDARFVAKYKDIVATKIELGGPKFTSDHMRNAFFAYLHHDVAIHPLALQNLGRPSSAPTMLDVMSFSPNYPRGLNTVWELKASETITAPYPLPKSAKPSIATDQGSPVEFVIYNHVHDKAPDQKQSHDDLRQKVYEAREEGNALMAWMYAKDLESRLGNCDADPALLCQDIQDLEASATPQSKLGRLLWASRSQNNSVMRSTALQVLLEPIKSGKAPAFLVKEAGVARARLKSNNLKDPTLKSVRADRLLEEALVKNPSDPEVYLSLAQVYAAQRRYEDSWNLQDALRRMPETPELLTAPINRVEQSLIRQAPAFFIPK